MLETLIRPGQASVGNAAVSVKNLHIRFGADDSGFTALSDVSVEIPAGSLVTMLGLQAATGYDISPAAVTMSPSSMTILAESTRTLAKRSARSAA